MMKPMEDILSDAVSSLLDDDVKETTLIMDLNGVSAYDCSNSDDSALSSSGDNDGEQAQDEERCTSPESGLGLGSSSELGNAGLPSDSIHFTGTNRLGAEKTFNISATVRIYYLSVVIVGRWLSTLLTR